MRSSCREIRDTMGDNWQAHQAGRGAAEAEDDGRQDGPPNLGCEGGHRLQDNTWDHRGTQLRSVSGYSYTSSSSPRIRPPYGPNGHNEQTLSDDGPDTL